MAPAGRLLALALVLAAALAAAGCERPRTPGMAPVELFPEIEPFETGYLKVSDLHELYFELSGQRGGIPVIGLHGGPGAASSPVMRRLTDPAKFLVVLFDQRGAGRSRPPEEIRENDTWALVEDIERLRKHLGLDRVVLFGGSWGATLALAHAEKYPQHVQALVLRGVFLCTREEIDHFYHGGSALQFPDAYAQLLSELPDPARRPLPGYLYALITESQGEERLRYCRAWDRYEGTMSILEVTAAFRERMEAWLRSDAVCTLPLFENYYMANGCFLEEGQLLRDAERLAGIPTYIVQGRYDALCPARTAWTLHRRIAGSKLVLAESSGHAGSEPNVQRALLGFFREIGNRPR